MASQPPPGEGEMGDKLTPEVARLLEQTLSEDPRVVVGAGAELNRLVADPLFPRSLLFLTRGTRLRLPAAMFLKNLFRRQFKATLIPDPIDFLHRRHARDPYIPLSIDAPFLTLLFNELFLCDDSIFDIFLESFQHLFLHFFIKEDMWPHLLTSLTTRVLSSTLVSQPAPPPVNHDVRVLRVLLTVCRPFKDKKPLAHRLPEEPVPEYLGLISENIEEPVPEHLALISKNILVPVLNNFHQLTEKALSFQGGTEFDQVVLVCKCTRFIVSSYMPSALTGTLPYFCEEILNVLKSCLEVATLRGAQLPLKVVKGCLMFLRLMVKNHSSYVKTLLPVIKTVAITLTRTSPDLTKNRGWSRVHALGFELRTLVTEQYQEIERFRNGSSHPEHLRVLKRAKSRYLPLEILNAIFMLVPVKSVTRFKALCKAVFALITSHRFMTEYETLNSRPRLLTLRTFDNEENTLHMSSYDTEYPRLINTFSVRFPAFFRLPDLEKIRVHSSGRLVCVTSDFCNDQSIVILQPSTEEAMSLPPFDFRFDSPGNTNTIGFGYGSSSGLFRVVKFSCSQSSLLTIVFTVGKSKWKLANSEPPFMCAPGSAPFLNGMLHLLPNPPYDNNPYISSFDLDTEKYNRVELPQGFPFGNDHDAPFSLTTLGGDLCLYVERSAPDAFLELMRLTNYEAGEWVTHCRIELFPLMVASSFTSGHRLSSVVGEDGGLLMSVAGRQLCNYDVNKRSFRWTLENAFPASLYKASLIRMKNGEPMNPNLPEPVDPEKAVNSVKFGEGPSTLQKSEQVKKYQDDVVAEGQVQPLTSELLKYRRTSELAFLREKEDAKLKEDLKKFSGPVEENSLEALPSQEPVTDQVRFPGVGRRLCDESFSGPSKVFDWENDDEDK